MSLPGLPCVIIGHNERIAWGVTNLHDDVQDLYREHLNLQTGEYLFRGKTEKAVLENDVIPVRGEADSTRHVGDAAWSPSAKR